MRARLLLIEDNPGDARLIQEMMALDEELTWVETLDDGVKAAKEGNFDAILLDLTLPDSQGIESVSTLHLFESETPIVVLTGMDEAAAMDAIAAGAHDYLVKGETDARALQKAIMFATQRLEVQRRLKPNGARGVNVEVTAYVCSPGPGFVTSVAERVTRMLGDGPVLFVCSDRPAEVMMELFEGRGVDRSVQFIDACGGNPADDARVFVVDQPKELDSVGLEIERACAAMGAGTHVVLDSINSLLLHHSVDEVAVFCHTLANRMRLLGISVDLLGHDNQEWPFIADRLSFVDRVDRPVTSEQPDPSVA